MRVVRRSGEAEERRRVGHCLLCEGGGDAAGGCVGVYNLTISTGFGAKEKEKGGRRV